jgi:hypothetical protein
MASDRQVFHYPAWFIYRPLIAPVIGFGLILAFIAGVAVDSERRVAALLPVGLAVIPFLIFGALAVVKGRKRWRFVATCAEGLEVAGVGPQRGVTAWSDVDRIQCLGWSFSSEPGLLVVSSQGDLFIHRRIAGFATLKEHLRREALARDVPFEEHGWRPGAPVP